MKKDCPYPHLFEPIRLGNQLFRNRIFASPTGYQNVHGDGHANEGAAAYYGRRARAAARPASRRLSASWTASSAKAERSTLPWTPRM